MVDIKYPNLDSGYAIVYGEENHWRTEVRSILCRTATGEQAALTHECRAEGVSPEKIFQGNNYEFVAIKTWLGQYMVRSGANQHGLGEQLPDSAYQLGNGRIDIDCPLANIHEFGFDEALKKVRNPTSGRYFIKVDYKFRGENWVIYAPARYINFPDANTAGRYL